MNIYVLRTRSDPGLPEWNVKGHNILFDRPTEAPDAIVSMSVTRMDETVKAVEIWPKVPLYVYNWDVYEWVWKNPRPVEYDYKLYGQVMKVAREIWVPSHCTGLRTTQWYGLNHWHVVRSCCPYWEYDDARDGGYALCCLREIPDPFWGKFEQACEELGIPYRSTKHECTEEKYRDTVANCRFICAPLYELSTGGLSLLEAYYHRKPVLISNSEWNGGRDYLGERAVYFKHDDWDDFKAHLRAMYDEPPTVPRGAKSWVQWHFSDERMTADLLARIVATI